MSCHFVPVLLLLDLYNFLGLCAVRLTLPAALLQCQSMCLANGCRSNRGLVDGYCRVHYGRKSLSTPSQLTNEPSAAAFSKAKKGSCTNSDLKMELEKISRSMNDVLQYMKQLEKENIEMTNELFDLHNTTDKLKEENALLKSKCNLNFIAADKLNQYGRKESFRAVNVREPDDADDDDPVEEIKKIAAALEIKDLSEKDIQRCHRVGKKRNGKPRPIIVKMRWYKKRMDFILNKKKLRPDTKNLSISEKKELLAKSPFITEDLTPYRFKIFRYVRSFNYDNNVFDYVTTYNGNILCKKDDNAYYIASTEDFLKAGIPYDENFKKEFDELLCV